MSVISVVEHGRRRRGSDNENLTSESVRCFTVKTDSTLDDENDIRASGMIPVAGSLHHKDPSKRCASVDYEQDTKDFKVWEVTCNYTNAVIPGGGIGDGGATEFGVPQRSWETVEVKKMVDKDVDNKPLLLTNLRPFKIEKPKALIRLKITRDEFSTYLVQGADFNGTLARQYHNRINNDSFSGADPGQVRLRISAQENRRGGTFVFWVVNYELEFDEDGWNPEVRQEDLEHFVYTETGSDEDLNVWDSDPTVAPAHNEAGYRKLQKILDDDGVPVTRPWPLDEYGRRIYKFYLEPEQADQYVIFKRAKIYKEAAFGDLNLPI